MSPHVNFASGSVPAPAYQAVPGSRRPRQHLLPTWRRSGGPKFLKLATRGYHCCCCGQESKAVVIGIRCSNCS